MKDVSSILTEKDYGHKTLKSNSLAQKSIEETGYISFDYPKWLGILFVFFIAVSGMGEDKTLNESFHGLPKAITMAVIVMAILFLIFKGDLKRFTYIGKTSVLYISYWASLALWSAILWVINFSEMTAISRGIEKTVFQTVAVLVAIAAVYLFGGKAIDLFAVAIYISNGMIAIMEMPNYGGPAACIESIIHLIITLGDGDGYALALEIHEMTFLYGMFVIYYAIFAPRNTKKEKRKNYIHIAHSIFFVLLGMKRILLLAIPLFVLIMWFIKRAKKTFMLVMAFGIFWVVFFFLYLYFVANNGISQLAHSLGVNMMGRDYIWGLVKKYYSFSPSYLGMGFGTVDAVIVKGLFEAGFIDKAYPLHNDILKVFIEFGFPGFVVWLGAQYILFPILLKRFFDDETALLYMGVLSLMSMTYMTDNTAFYFWCMMVMRLIPLAYGVYRKNLNPIPKKELSKKWSPPSRDDFEQLVREKMADNQRAGKKAGA